MKNKRTYMKKQIGIFNLSRLSEKELKNFSEGIAKVINEKIKREEIKRPEPDGYFDATEYFKMAGIELE